MAMARSELYNLLIAAFPDAQVIINALVEDDDHYAVTIFSKSFKGKNRIEQHKMVYNALDGQMGTRLHALSLTTKIKED